MGGVMPMPDEILDALHGIAFAYRSLEDGVESRYM
jgi:hypothetical protein